MLALSNKLAAAELRDQHKLPEIIVKELRASQDVALGLFATGDQWDNEHRFVPLLESLSDQFSRQELILSLGRTSHIHWFPISATPRF